MVVIGAALLVKRTQLFAYSVWFFPRLQLWKMMVQGCAASTIHEDLGKYSICKLYCEVLAGRDHGLRQAAKDSSSLFCLFLTVLTC